MIEIVGYALLETRKTKKQETPSMDFLTKREYDDMIENGVIDESKEIVALPKIKPSAIKMKVENNNFIDVFGYYHFTKKIK